MWVDDRVFVNFYEVFEISPHASAEAIERRFRQLARRYHPDNQATGDRALFDAVVEANETLKDPDRRARYHEQHAHHFAAHLAADADSPSPAADGAPAAEPDDLSLHDDYLSEIGIARDLSIQNNILALLYHRRRRQVGEPGIGDAELERLTGCPHEHLAFHLWYLKAKGWIAREEDGQLAITVYGVDRSAAIYRESLNKLITDRTGT